MTYKEVALERLKSIGLTDVSLLEEITDNMTDNYYTTVFVDFERDIEWDAEVKKAKEAKLKEIKQERYDCVKKAYETYEKLRDEYTKDYGYFTINTIRSNDDIDDFFSRIFR